MASSSEEVLEAAVARIPEIARIIASLPVEDRASAFDVAERSYLRTAKNLRRQRRPCSEVGLGSPVSFARGSGRTSTGKEQTADGLV